MHFGNKPKDLEFLIDTLSGIKYILFSGIIVKDKVYTILFRCVTCDAPAKAFVKGTKQFNGKHGCDKCKSLGK